MNYLVAVLSDKDTVEKAYSALEQKNLSLENVVILGEGYESADDFGLINPNQRALKRSRKLAYWLIPFGFVAGYAFNLLTGIDIIGTNNIINHIIGGILGGASGALGALLVGGAVGWTVGSGDALPYRNRLNAGKYLIIAKGEEQPIRQATAVLRPFEPENIQGYREPANASSS